MRYILALLAAVFAASLLVNQTEASFVSVKICNVHGNNARWEDARSRQTPGDAHC